MFFKYELIAFPNNLINMSYTVCYVPRSSSTVPHLLYYYCIQETFPSCLRVFLLMINAITWINHMVDVVAVLLYLPFVLLVFPSTAGCISTCYSIWNRKFSFILEVSTKWNTRWSKNIIKEIGCWGWWNCNLVAVALLSQLE